MHWGLYLVAIGALCIAIWPTDNFDPSSIQGKSVLVTGASTGIGEQLAYHYARLGARLVITARRESLLRNVIARCKELGPKDGDHHYVVADMSHMEETKTVIDTAARTLGGLDVLVLNHKAITSLGIYLGSAKNLTSFDTIMDINTRSYVHLASHALPLLQQHAGSIIAISSLAGKVSAPLNIMYASSKFAVDGFFHGLRQELALRQIPVSVTVCTLGFIATETAMEKFKDADMVKPADVSDSALAIIKGGASRVREIYYPYWSSKVLTLTRDLLPSLSEKLFAHTFAPILELFLAG